MEFGRSLMQREFCLEETSTHLNNASGAVPKKVFDYQISVMEERERNPEHWYRYVVNDRYMNAVAKVAEFIGCCKENLVLVETTTSGINAVAKAMSWEAGDAILCTDHTYGANINLVQHVAKENKGLDVIQMHIPLPLEHEDEVIKAYADVIEKSHKIKLAIIDHISSASAIMFPVKKLVDLCREKGVMTLIDGAHCPGQVQLDLENLGADYYIGNLHKWMFCPRGCALLWIHPSHHDTTHPIITSASIFHTNLQQRFSQQATRDPIPYLTAPKAIEFCLSLGGLDAIVARNSKLVKWAASMLSEAWTSTCLPIPISMRAPFMILIGLPDTKVTRQYELEAKELKCPTLMKVIYEKHRVFTAISYFMGKLWCRVSVQVHNCQEDYYKLRDAILDVLKDEP
ncbi:uncharacterized protein [Amphiura filiformis]|uniref:uncharacterized protein n=1 Tax=Amphiura filiformis TaxID=82378 RepID=UPI003B20E2D5